MKKQGLHRIADSHGSAWLLCSICLIMPSGARACACSQAPPGACPGLHKGDVVFLGTVNDIDEAVAPPTRASAEPQIPVCFPKIQALKLSDRAPLLLPAPLGLTIISALTNIS